MEDLWRVKGSGADMKDLADIVEYRHFLKRFSDEEEQVNRRQLLYGVEEPEKKKSPVRD